MPLSTVPISPLPGQEDQSARLAASAEVGQVEGTNALEHFQRWLETKAHAASARVDGSSDYPTASELGHLYVIAKCRAATELLMQFKLEQGQ